MWNGILLEHCPVFGVCNSSWDGPPVAATHLSKETQMNSVDMADHKNLKETVTPILHSFTDNSGALGHPYSMDKVVMTGTGLQHAIVNQLAEFFIDGSNAEEALLGNELLIF